MNMTHCSYLCKMNYIYVLIDPRNEFVRYVGKTKNPNRRLAQHIYESNKIKCHKNNWLKQLLEAGVKPEMVIVESLQSTEDWIFWEQFYIDLCKSWEFNLTNTLEGGSGKKHITMPLGFKKKPFSTKGFKHSSETKAKISEASKKRKVSLETREKMSKYAKARGISEETKRKMLESRRKSGWKHSEESKKRISETMKILRNEQRINRGKLDR